MSKKILHRNSVRNSFGNVMNELEQELQNAERGDFKLLKMLWRRAEDRYENLQKLDNEIWDDFVERDISQEEMNDEFNDVQEFRDKWSDVNCRLDEIFKSEQSVVQSSMSANELKRYKLPKLKLVEFDGNPRDWLGFWSQFKEIHNDESLSNEVKFQYLIQATAIESEARRVVSSFPPTQENYQKAIGHLKSRFGKDKVLIEVYVRDLLKLVLSNSNGQQTIQLATLYDKLETQLRSLESLGVTTDKYAAMLYPLVESALSEDVLRTWERIRNQKQESGDVDQLQQLMEFLRSEVESDVRLKMAKRNVTEDNENCIASVKAKIISLLNEEAAQWLGCGMTYTLFECLKEKFVDLLNEQPDEVPSDPTIVSAIETIKLGDDTPAAKNVKVKKEHLTKSKKRRQWEQRDHKGEKPRGYNWVDIVKHLSQTGGKEEGGALPQNYDG